MIATILQIEEDVLTEKEIQPYEWEKRQWVQRNMINQLVTYAMLNDQDSVSRCIERIDSEMAKAASHDKIHWTWVANPSYLGALELLKESVQYLMQVNKASLIFPYLCKVAERCEAYAKKQDDFEERYLYPLYGLVVECADRSSGDDACGKGDRRQYWDVESEYRTRMENLTGATYRLNWESYEDT